MSETTNGQPSGTPGETSPQADATPAPATADPKVAEPNQTGNNQAGGEDILSKGGEEPAPGNPAAGQEPGKTDGAGEPAAGNQNGNDTQQVPEKYEFKMPEGFTIDEDVSKNLTEIAKSKNMSQDEVQKLVDLHADGVKKTLQNFDEYIKAENKKAVEEDAKIVKGDPELGGQNFDKTVKLAKLALNTFDKTGDVVGILQSYGLQNHPAFVRLFKNIGMQLEGETIVKGQAAPQDTRPRDPAGNPMFNYNATKKE